MTLQQIKNKVKDLGEVRGYWADKSTSWRDERYSDVYYFGQRGSIIYSDYGENIIYFRPDYSSESGLIVDDIMVERAFEVHVPEIGHYSW